MSNADAKEKDSEQPDVSTWPILIAIVAGTIFVFAVLGATMYCVPRRFSADGAAGQFGDMFGAANALFSGLAFLGVIAAILLQRVELIYQRHELKATTKELAGQKEQMERQNASLTQQSFDNTFFNMLSLHHEIVNGIDTAGYSGSPNTGRDCFVCFTTSYNITLRGQKMS